MKDGRIRHVPTLCLGQDPWHTSRAGPGTDRERRELVPVQDKIPTQSLCTREDLSLYSSGTKRGWGEKVEKFKCSLEKP